ncbi:hypothetical protein NTE_03399 [Candidatus Nitrososphaera evergladensis SR1]|uniref:C2H2-type domain-containing protein n=1 Tax=Candidatus Nitrososphaera evergladensis SR1 TaxID=1459636 RepID=A0A075MXT7_9ARCH|nr:hypothetical protein NTE_03399 [Candidatus Nitrososphaera evergladensis SR1]
MPLSGVFHGKTNRERNIDSLCMGGIDLKRRIKIFRCPDCRKGFESLRGLNDHITKTGHNERQKIRAETKVTSRGLSVVFIACAAQASSIEG